MKKNKLRLLFHRYSSPASILVSLVLHGVLLGIIYLGFLSSFFMSNIIIKFGKKPQQKNIEYTIELTYIEEENFATKATDSSIPPQVPAPFSKSTIDNVKQNLSKLQRVDTQKLLAQGKNWAQNLQAKYHNLQKFLVVHNKFVSDSGQNEVLDLLGKNFTHQDFVPRSIPGEFDWDDFTIYSIEQITRPRGYHVVFVDRQGHTVERKIYGEEAKDFASLYRVFRISQNSVLLKKLVDYVLKSTPKWLDSKKDK